MSFFLLSFIMSSFLVVLILFEYLVSDGTSLFDFGILGIPCWTSGLSAYRLLCFELVPVLVFSNFNNDQTASPERLYARVRSYDILDKIGNNEQSYVIRGIATHGNRHMRCIGGSRFNKTKRPRRTQNRERTNPSSEYHT
jgi:hypothetical protein